MVQKPGRIFDFYPLEDRILLNGDGLDGADVAADVDPELMTALLAEVEAAGPAAEDPAVATELSATEEADVTSAELADLPAFDATRPLEVVFVDFGVEDADTLLSGLRGGGDDQTQWLVVALSADQDGVVQVTQTLSQLSAVDAVHLISHGDTKGIQLGNARLDVDTAAGYAGEIASWANSLDADADLLIYGCDLASTADGQALIDSLGALCDCDVAASDDATGHESLGGDWELEYTLGSIESSVAFSLDAQHAWLGLLETIDVPTAGDADNDPSVVVADLPLAFEENTGQTDAAVDFMARGSGYSVFLADGDAVIDIANGDSRHVVRLDLVGAKTDLIASGEDALASRSNYLIGASENWQADVANYNSVRYESVYDGVGLRYYGNQRQLEYDFIVDAGADTSVIRLNFDGVSGIEVTGSGELKLALNDAGDFIIFKAPVSYQLADDGSQIAIESSYVIHEDGTVGFALGDYDSSRELVIDPVLDYTTFVGGTGYDTVEGIASDSAGNVYITGWTGSTDFPTTAGSYDQTYGGGSYDIYVAKLSADGSTLLYSTFIGGSGNDTANAIDVDSSGNVYVTGTTSSSDFGTVNAFQNSLSGTSDAVLLKLNSAGNALLYSTYFGGTDAETGYDLVLDDSGFVHLGGFTKSADLPLLNAYDSTLGGTQDGLLAKFDTSQSGAASLLYASYFGGSGSEDIRSLDVDAAGNVYVAGLTTATDLTTVNGYQTSNGGGNDAFVTKFNSTGSAVLYSTYLGGSSTDYAEAIAVDSSGNVYVGGRTDGVFATTAGAYDTTAGGSADGFVSKLDPTLSGAASLIYSTYLGSTAFDYVLGLDVDDSGVAYVGGFTGSSAFPTTIDGNDRVMTGANDGFFAALNATGTGLTYSTFIGGSDQDRAKDVFWNVATGSAYVGGQVGAQDGPTSPTPTSLGPGGGTDGYVAKFTFISNTAPTISSNGGGATASVSASENSTAVTIVTATDPNLPAQTLTYSITGGADAAKFNINSSTGELTFAAAPDFESPTDVGADNVYDATVQVSDGAGGTDSQDLSVTVTNQAITSLTATGSGSIAAGSLYTLNLSADEDATGWTINWGDGTFDTIVGDPATATHTYTSNQMGLTFAITASATDVDGTYFESDLLLADFWGGTAEKYDGQSGSQLQEYPSNAGLAGPADVLIGPDGLLYVSGYTSDTVVRYNASTGAFVDVFVSAGSGGLDAPTGLAFGKDGSLLVSSYNTDSIKRYDATTGAYIDDFVTAAAGGIDAPVGMTFGTDGNLYAAGWFSNTVVRYDGDTGAFIDTFVTTSLDQAADLQFGPDGNLYVSSRGGLNAGVDKYDGATGAYLGNVLTATSTFGIAFGPDGNLYVSSETGDNVQVYNTSGTLLNTLSSSGDGISGPWMINFTADQQVTVIEPTNALIVDTTSDVSDGNTSSIAALKASMGADGKISFREAIIATNNTANLDGSTPDQIWFEITDPLIAGAHIINVSAAGLPGITDAVIVDGSTDSDFAGSPVIVLNGVSYSGDGLVLQAGSDGSTIRGLVIHQFGDAGLKLIGSDNHTIVGNYIGTDATGTVDLGNTRFGIELNNSGSNQIGGSTAADRNVISGNGFEGISLWNTGSTLNVIQGNYIGVDKTGNAGLGNSSDGIVIGGGANNNTIGGDRTAGEGNVISGQIGATSDGIEIDNAGADNNKIYGNYIGTNFDGTTAIGNARYGVVIYNGVQGTLIGGTDTGQGNIISGNIDSGIIIDGNGQATTTGNVIQANIIGLNAAGTATLANGGNGVYVIGSPGANRIGTDGNGTDDLAERNVISGNSANGIRINSSAAGFTIAGNYIGTDITGLLDRGNINDGIGIYGGSHTIGGDSVAERNVISGNNQYAIYFTSAATSGNTVSRNYIGVASDGSGALGNTDHGIVIDWFSSGNLIGGTDAGAGNTIANNGGNGIFVFGNNAIGNSILGNSIHTNTGLGIDLGTSGVTNNDANDSDAGPNELQNFPVITQADLTGSNLTLSGTIDTDGPLNTQYRIEFFGNATGSQDPTHGEAREFLGETTVAVNASGDGVFTGVVLGGVTLSAGDFVTATATRIDDTGQVGVDDQLAYGDSSEFAANFTVSGNSPPTDLTTVATETGGLELNTDGGNDVYLLAADGDAIFNGLTATTMEIQFASTTLPVDGGDADFVTYGAATPSSNNIWFGTWRDDAGAGHQLGLGIDDAYRYATGFDANTLFDGELHTVSTTWDNVSGDYEFFVDGVSVGSGTGLKSGHSVPSGGELVVGMEQDSVGGGFQSDQVLQATIYDVRIFDDARNSAEILAGHGQTLAPSEDGMLANWVFNDLSTGGIVTDVVSGNDLTVMHASGAGFTPSYPTLSLVVSENDPNGTVIASIGAIDPDSGDTFTYTLTDNAGGRFAIDSTTGQITLVNTGLVDFESASEHIITARVTDSGGLTYDEAMTIVVSDVAENAAPILDDSNMLTLDPITEDSGAPVGSVGTLVSSLVDLTGGGGLDNVTDADSGGLTGIAVTQAATGMGTWYYSIDDGANWNLMVGATNDNSLLLAADSGSRLYFEPNANFTGLAVNPLNFRAWDQTSGTNGSFADTTVNGGTSAFSSVVEFVSVPVTAVNDAPVANIVASAIGVNEDDGYRLLGGFSVSDVDAGGSDIAFTLSVGQGTINLTNTTGLTLTAGANNSATMTFTGSVSNINTALETVTYKPDANFNGTDTIALSVDDQGNTGSGGPLSDADSANIIVSARNDAPTLNDGFIVGLPGADEDSATVGTTVAAIVDNASWSDIDVGAVKGMAVTSVSGNGAWQYSTDGLTWNSFGAVSITNTLLLNATTQVRYVGDGANGEIASFDFRAWDTTTGTASTNVTPAYADPGSGGSTSAFSSEVATANTTVTSLNDAPLLDTLGLMDLPSVLKNSTDPSGSLVSTIIASAAGDRITDVDLGAVEGIAVTSVDDGNGTWQYSTNGGSTWTAFGAVTNGNAVVLTDTASDRIRFVPNTDYVGNATFDFRAWDTTDGNTSGTTGVNTGSGGGTTAVSADTENVSIEIEDNEIFFWYSTASDVGPTGGSGGGPVSGTPGLANWSEGEVVGFGDPNMSFGLDATDGTFLSITDFDAFAADSDVDLIGMHYVANDITVAGTGITDGTIDLQKGDLIFATLDAETLSNAAVGAPAGWSSSIATSAGDVYVFRAEFADDPSSGYFRQVMSDPSTNGLAGITLVEQATTIGGDTLLAAGDFLFSQIGLADKNDISWYDTSLNTSVKLIEGDDLGISRGIDGLQFIDEGQTLGGVAVGTGTVFVSLDQSDSIGSNNLSVAEHDVVELEMMATTLGSGTAVASAEMVFDGDDVSLDHVSEDIDALTLVVRGIGSNQGPVLGQSGAAANFVENGAPVIIDSTITVVDADSPDFASGLLRVDITVGADVNDRLQIFHQGTGPGQIGVDHNAVTYEGVSIANFSGGNGSDPLVFSLNANADAISTRALMRNITFANVSDDPGTAVRTVEFVLTDGDGAGSNIISQSVNVSELADAPRAVDDNFGLDFDGVDDYVTIADSASLTMTNTMTMEAWINPDASANVNRMIINKEGEYEVALFSDNRIYWAFANTDPGWAWHDTGYTVTNGQWTHVAVTYDNGTVSTYVNGTVVQVYAGTGSIGDSHATLDELRIGGRSNSPAGKYFDGRIDDVRIWNTARTQAEIQTNLDVNLTGAETGLAGFWNFNEGTGISANDLTANTNHGTLTDGAATGTPLWDGYTTDQDTQINIVATAGIASNDVDGDGDTLTVTQVNGSGANVGSMFTLPSGGNLTVGALGDFIYDSNGAFDYLATGQTATDSFTYQIDDGNGGTDTATVNITIIGINDAPQANSLSAAESYTEELSLDLTDIIVSDVDDTDVTVTLTIADIGAGSLSTGTSGAVTSTFAGGVWTASGAIADVNTLLAGVTFTPTGEYATDFTIVTSVDDGEAAPVTGVKNFTATPINDAPILTAGSVNNLTVLEDSGFNSLALGTVNYGPGGGADEASQSLTYQVSVIPSPVFGDIYLADGLTKVTTTTYTLAQLQGMQFKPADDASGGPSFFSYQVIDNGGGTDTLAQSIQLNVTSVNDAPTVATNTGMTVLEGSTGTPLSPAMLSEGDVDDSGTGLIYTITNVTDNGTMYLSGFGALGLNDTFTQADIDAGDVTYDHNDSEASTDAFSFSLADGGEDGSTPATGTFNFTINPVNDAPVVNAPGSALSATEQLGLNIHGAGFSVTDVDEAGVGARAVISVGEGIITIVEGDSGVTVDAGNNSGSVTILGTIAQINNLLTGGGTGTITYLNSSDSPSASTTISVLVNDAGNTGADPGLTADATSEEGSNSQTINITAVNDEQVLSTNTGATVLEGSSGNVITTAMLETTDLDHSATQLTYTVTAIPTNGLLRRLGVNLTVSSTFTQADIDGGLISYLHNGTETTSDSFAFTVDDGTGTTSAGTFNITVTAVNDNSTTAISDSDVTVDAVLENAIVGTTVGVTAFADDADAGDTITYSLDDNDGGRFRIDAVTGMVTVDGVINRETDGPTRSITVRATSTDASSTTQDFVIGINDVDEFDVGTITDSNATANAVDENAANGTAVAVTALATDADATNNTITYTLGDDAGGRFAINSSTGVVTVADGTLLDREAAASHIITVRATSSDASFNTAVMGINVNDVDEFNVGALSDTDTTIDAVAENAIVGTTVGITADASDADATTNAITYTLQDNDGGRFAINSSTGEVTVAGAIDREAGGASRNITVRATSTDGSFTDQVYVIAITDVDEFDVGMITDSDAAANAVDENAANGTAVAVTALASDADATNNTITYTMDDDASGRFAIDGSTGVVTVADGTQLDREAAASHNITVRATSSDGSFDTAVMTINVNDVDEFDVGVIGDSDASVDEVAENAGVGASVAITALATDGDATSNMISYSLTDDAGGRFAIDSVTGEITVNASLDYESNTSHSVIVRANSIDGSFSTQGFTINVADVSEFGTTPIVDNDVTPNLIVENAVIGTAAGVTAFSDDADGSDTIAYSLDDDDGGRFTIDSGTGVVTVAGAIDRETDGPTRSIAVRATSTDGSFQTQSFSITIGDVDEFDVAVVSDADGTTNEIAENAGIGTNVGITAAASDADATTNAITYSLLADDGGRFVIDSGSGIVTLNAAIDREVDGPSRNITVRATSADGSFTDQIFAIAVNDVDEFDVGVIADTDLSANAVGENAVAGTSVGITASASDPDATTNTITYSLLDDDGGRFAIDANSGLVTVAAAIDREADGANRSITVRATSADGSFSDQIFAIGINDVDEFNVGLISDNDAAANLVSENAANGTVVGITALATDNDATNNTIFYALDDDAGGRFAIDGVSGVVTVADGTLLDREAAASHNITVRAMSSDGSSNTRVMTVNLSDVDEFDVGPVTDSDVALNEVNENAANGTTVGVTGMAADPDATNNTITYTLDDDAGGRFAIDGVNGVVSVADGTLLDREAAASHNIIVRATSSDGSFRTAGMLINVLDVDEFDVGAVSDTDLLANNVDENALVGTTVRATASASDADATTNAIVYSLLNDDGGRFTIDSNSGVVTVAGAIDREADGATRNITLRATSADGSFTDQVFSININDVDEFDVGVIVDSDATIDEVPENAAIGTSVGITAQAIDADATNNTITYTLDDDAGGRFAIDGVTGEITVNGGLDYETDTSHNVIVRATSSDGSVSTQSFAISVTDTSDFSATPIADNDPAADWIVENAAIGTTVGVTAFSDDADASDLITYSLDDNDSGRFSIDSTTGVVTVAAAIDREVDGASRSITVRATSTDGSFQLQSFSISIDDVDEFDVGGVSDTDGAINGVEENTAIGTTVGVTASAGDADATNNVISYTLLDDDGGRFAIDSGVGLVTVAGVIDREIDGSSRNITVRATSADGSFTDQVFSININDVDEFDVAAVTDTDGAINQVAENAAIGTTVGVTAAASDADATTNAVSYSLFDDDGARFTIDSASGVVTVSGGIDREADGPVRNITVRATSADGSSTDQVFSININDVDEFNVGAITDSNATVNVVDENAANGTVVAVTALASDADATNNTITYSLDDDAGGRFAIGGATGVVTVAGGTLLDREAAASHNITVRADSSDGSSSTQVMTINLNDVDEFNVGPILDSDIAVNAVDENAANGTVVGVTALASDADVTNNTIAYSLDDDAAGRFAIDSSTGVVTVADGTLLDRESAASHNIITRASSSDGSSSTQAMTISVNDIDEFNVGPINDNDASVNGVDENAANGSLVGVTALASDADATNNTITYSLDDNAGGRFEIDSLTGVVTVADGTQLDRETAASHNITVRAGSSDGSVRTQVMTINVNDIDEFNVGPIADADASTDQVAENAGIGTAVGITAVATDADATNNAITYTLDDAAGGRFAIDGSSGLMTVNAALDFESNASHNVTVRATSSDGSSSTRVLTINVTDTSEFSATPIVDSDATADAIDENAGIGTAVGITAFSDDADGTDTISYSLDDDDGGRFTIDTVTGIVSVAGGIDRETDGANRSITIRVSSTDSSFQLRTFTIAINDVDEFVVGPISDNDVTVNAVDENAANGTVVGVTALASDADATNNTVTYSLDDNAGGRFAIGGATGIVTVADGTLLDRESAASHNITVRATSSDGSLSTQVMLINVNDINEFTVGAVSDSDATANVVDENAANGTVVGVTALASDADATNNTVTYSLDDDAGGRFAIDAATGVVTVADGTLLDREAAANHNVTVRATSSDGSTSTQAMTIILNDIDEFNVGVVSDSDAAINQVAENSATGTSVGITASAIDPDTTANAITYSLQDNDGGRFTVDSATGLVTVAAALDREADGPTRNITVRATSADGSFSDQAFSINIVDIDEFDASPITDVDTAVNTVTENASVGTTVGITTSANDLDATNNTLVYSLDDSDSGRFAIDGATGEVTVAGAIDREADGASRNITVRATSSDGSSTTQTFTINITDIDEFDATATVDTDIVVNHVDENAGIGTVVGITGSAADHDATGNTITYSLDDNDGGRFAIDSSSGVVTVGGAIDREVDGTSRSITVRSTSSDGSFSIQSFVISVNDVDEFGVSTPTDSDSAVNIVTENSALGSVVGITALATDSDATDVVSYSLSDSAGGRFAIDNASGLVTVSGSLDFETSASHNLTVRATSTDGSIATQVFSISLVDINEAPVAIDDNGYSVAAGTTLTLDAPSPLTNDFDVDGDALLIQIVSAPTGGTLTVDAFGNLVYTPNSGFIGADTMTYRVDDGALSSNLATININVIAGVVGVRTDPAPDPDPTPDPDPVEGGDDDNDDDHEDTSESETETSETSNAAVVGPNSDTSESSFLRVRAASEDNGDAGATTEAVDELVALAREYSLMSSKREADAALARSSELAMFERLLQLDLEQAIVWQQWDRTIFEEEVSLNFYVGTAGVAAGLFSIGYVFWAIRGGAFFAAITSTLPSWRLVDPAALLNAYRASTAATPDRIEKMMD